MDRTSAPVLELRDVTIWFPPNRMLFYRINLAVAPGEHVLISFGAGRGKTSLFECLCGLCEPQEGKIMICGEEITGQISKTRELFPAGQVGTIPEGNPFFHELTGEENLRLAGGFPCRRRGRQTWKSREDFWIREMGLISMELRRCKTLTKEERCRLALVRACQNHPRLILADNFTRGLSEEEEERFWQDWQHAKTKYFCNGIVPPAWLHLSDHLCPEEPVSRVISIDEIRRKRE